MDTNNKEYWVNLGVEKEEKFLKKYSSALSVIRNPGRAFSDYVPDFAIIADLKSISTPFYTASKYGLDPQYTVSLNVKDVDYYSREYPGIIIIFHVKWETTKYRNIVVKKMDCIYRVSLFHLQYLIAEGTGVLHSYRERGGNNAKSSYLFDVRFFERIK